MEGIEKKQTNKFENSLSKEDFLNFVNKEIENLKLSETKDFSEFKSKVLFIFLSVMSYNKKDQNSYMSKSDKEEEQYTISPGKIKQTLLQICNGNKDKEEFINIAFEDQNIEAIYKEQRINSEEEKPSGETVSKLLKLDVKPEEMKSTINDLAEKIVEKQEESRN